MGLEDDDNSHAPEYHALVEINRYYEDSYDDGLLKSVPRGSTLSEERLKHICNTLNVKWDSRKTPRDSRLSVSTINWPILQ